MVFGVARLFATLMCARVFLCTPEKGGRNREICFPGFFIYIFYLLDNNDVTRKNSTESRATVL